ncbi:MAG: hypothetical protein ABI383_04235 [Acidobacteriaceae bacterium]
MENSAEEWSKIQKRYAKLSDGELLKLEGARDQLTDTAKQLLLNEINMRNLAPHKTAVEEMEEKERFVRIAEFTDLGSTLFMKSALESLDIDAKIEGQEEKTLEWFMRHAPDGLGLFVRMKNVDAALEIIRNPYEGEEE